MYSRAQAGVRACVHCAQDADSGVLISERRFGDVRVLVCAITHVRTHAMRVRGAEVGWVVVGASKPQRHSCHR